MPYLVDAVKELEEYLRSIVTVAVRVVLASFREHVAKRDPVFLNEDLESLKSAVIRVNHQLCQRAKLGRAIPAIRAMDQNVILLVRERMQDLIRACNYSHQNRPVARIVEYLMPALRC